MEASRGFSLAYKRDFLVVDRYFIESLSLDPDEEDWAAIGFNWVCPRRLLARRRLHDKLIATLPGETERSSVIPPGRGGKRLRASLYMVCRRFRSWLTS